MNRRYLAVAANGFWTLSVAVCVFAGGAHADSAVLVPDQALCQLFPDSTCFSPLNGTNFADDAFTALATAEVDTLEILEGAFQLIDANIMLGMNGVDSVLGLGAPEKTILRAALNDFPVVEIMGADVLIEAVTLRGGTNGIHVLSSATAAKINRVRIIEASEDGILVSGIARIANVSVSGSGGDGIQTENATEIVLSTILKNGANGINVVNPVGSLTSIFGCNITDNGAAGSFGIVGPLANIDENGNNVWNNGDPGDTADEYGGGAVPSVESINFTVPGGVDPGYAATQEWAGQLGPNPVVGNPLDVRDYLTITIPGDFTETDFDGHVRPQGLPLKQSEIGADEINNDPSASRAWIFCEVTPDPAGRLPQDQLLVRLRITGLPDGTFRELESGDFANALNKVVVVPYQSRQLGVTTAALVADEADISIPLTVSERASGAASNFYVCTNAVPLDSPLDPNGASTYLDGPARVVVLIQGVELTPFVPSQAETGRDFLIDTIPPKLYVGLGMDGAGFFVSHNDTFAPSPPFPLPTDPTPPVAAPVTRSTILPNETSITSASIFFNVGAPPEVPTDLEFTLRTQFYDPLPNPNANPPEWSAAVPLPPASAGFDPLLTGSVTINATELTSPVTLPFMPRWRLDDGSFGSGQQLVAEFSNPDVDFDGTNDLQVRWHFLIADGNAIPFTAANAQGYLHWAMRFQGVDKARNGIVATESDLLEPLHLWWILGARTELKPYVNEEVDRVDFSWNLKQPPQVTSNFGVEPLFAFRFLKLSTVAPDNKGPYVPLDLTEATAIGLSGSGQDGLPWHDYDTRTTLPFEDPTIGLRRIFDPSIPELAGLQDTWMLLIVVGRDEAGNYELFPTDELGSGLVQDAGGAIFTSSQSGRNWQRFKLSASSAIDTEASVTFWHDVADGSSGVVGEMDTGESVFGSVRLVPLPPEEAFNKLADGTQVLTERVDARFVVTMTTPVPTSTFLRFTIRGGEVDETPVDINVSQNPWPISLMNDVLVPKGANWLGDLQRKTPITYQVTIATVVTVGGAEQVDETPVNISFTVVPNVQEYIQNKTSPDEQPVKSVETS